MLDFVYVSPRRLTSVIVGAVIVVALAIFFEEVRIAQLSERLEQACGLLYETDRAMISRRIDDTMTPNRISVMDHMDTLINGWEAPESYVLAQRHACG